MTTYRTGNVAGFPLPAVWHGEALIAVVVNGDQALAERICTLLNADQRCWHGEHCDGSGPECERDAPLKGGHRDCADAWHGCCTEPYDGDAPSGPLSAPVSAEQPPVGESGRPGGAETISSGCPETIWDGPYAMRCGRGSGTGDCPRHGAVI